MTRPSSNGAPPPDPDADRLGAAWDALVSGSPPEIDARDADLLDLVRSLQRGMPVGVPDARFKADLKEKMMSATATLAPSPTRDVPPVRTLPTLRRSAREATDGPWRLRGWIPTLASAALLLLAVGLALRTYWPAEPRSSGGRNGPAIVAPGTPSPEASTDRVLLAFPLPAEVVPTDGHGDIGIRLFVMAPASTATWTGEMSDKHPGFWANYLLAGSMTVTADADFEVIHADGRHEPAPAGTDIALGPGDTALHRVGTALAWANPGTEPAQILAFYLSSDYFTNYPHAPQWEQTGYGVKNTASIPPGEWEVRLSTSILEPGSAIPAPASPNLQFGVAGPETDAYLAADIEGQLILRGATAATRVYIFTLAQIKPGAGTPEP